MRKSLLVCLSLLLVGALAAPASAAKTRTKLVSKTKKGVPANGTSGDGVATPDGRYVAFHSNATNLAGGHPDYLDVFLKDMSTGKVRLVSKTKAGIPGNANSSDPALSADGRYVAFETRATNLGSTAHRVVALKDMKTGRVRMVSVGSAGQVPDNDSFGPSISDDGSVVAFDTHADNMGGHQDYRNVYMRLWKNGVTRLLNKAPDGAPGDGASDHGMVSANGRFVTFISRAANLGANGLDAQVFLHNRKTGKNRIVSKSSAGAIADGRSNRPSVSGDGSLVVFMSYAANLGAGTHAQCFAHKVATGKTRLVSKTSSGVPGDDECMNPSVSRNGRYVAFESDASNLGGTTVYTDVFLHTLGKAKTLLVSRKGRKGPPANGESYLHTRVYAVTSKGPAVFFTSDAPNLGNPGVLSDIFVRGPFG